MDRERRKAKGEIRETVGLAIINPYGGVWTDEVFNSPEEARDYLKRSYPEADHSKFKLAHAVLTVEVYRDLAEPKFYPIPE